MISRTSFFATSFCDKLCLEDSKYHPEDGIIIQLVPKPLVSKHSNQPLKGLSLTHKPQNTKSNYHSNPPQSVPQCRTKSSESLQPKKKLNLTNLNIKNDATASNLISGCSTTKHLSQKLFMSLNISVAETPSHSTNKRPISILNLKKDSKCYIRDSKCYIRFTNVQQKGNKPAHKEIHELRRKAVQKQNKGMGGPYFENANTSSAPLSPKRKKVYLRLHNKKRNEGRAKWYQALI